MVTDDYYSLSYSSALSKKEKSPNDSTNNGGIIKGFFIIIFFFFLVDHIICMCVLCSSGKDEVNPGSLTSLH